MRIIHYIFGMPPLRGGGAIKYAMDLAEKQAEIGQNVSLIYPGEIRKRNEKIVIRKSKSYHKVSVFEIINPLPVPLVTGIREIEPFIKKGDRKVYKKFLIEQKVEVMHVHSLMGLHIEFLEAAKECGVKILVTTHDYFGVCPKTNLLYQGKLCNSCEWENCVDCCKDAEEVSALIRRQTHWFQFLIHFKALVKLKHMLTSTDANQSEEPKPIEIQRISGSGENIDYGKLRQYYMDEFELINVILYNSSVAKEQYEKRIQPKHSVIIGGMHKDIRDCRKQREYGKVIRFAYLGYPVEYKGYHLLIRVMDELDKKYHAQFELNMYMESLEKGREYIKLHEPFSHAQLKGIYSDMDMLIVPSLGAETYGLVVLEALSYGVPVIATSNVGAGDLLCKYKGIGDVVAPTESALYDRLEQIITDRTILIELNKAICVAPIELDYDSYVGQILAIYEQND